jgi:2-aminoadipate transaminase
LERVRSLLRVRRDAMLESLEQDFPAATWSRPEGGYFIWLELPEPLTDADGVTFVPGTDFGGAANTVRLAFSFVSPAEIREGVRRLAEGPRDQARLARRHERAAAVQPERRAG